MKNLKQDNKNQSDFFNELSEVKLLSPVNMDIKNKNAKGNETIIGEGSSISIISIAENNNNKYLMAFTDWDELRKWNSNKSQQTLVFTCDDYKSIMKQTELKYQGVVINPYGENLVITLPMLENIGKSKHILAKGEKVMIGEPSDYPTEMV